MKITLVLLIAFCAIAVTRATDYGQCRVYIPTNCEILNFGYRKYAKNHEWLTYKCKSGFSLHGSSRRQCKNGKLSGDPVSCRKSTGCLVTAKPVGGTVNPAVGQTVAYGRRVIYECNKAAGYTLHGDGNQLCHKNGRFSGSVPRCVKVSGCRVNAKPVGGTVNPAVGQTVAYGRRVIYECNKAAGYTLHGDGNQLCHRNGRFSGSVPRCVKAVVKKCKVLGKPEGGSANPGVGSYVSPGRRVIYTCGSDHILEGDGNQLCHKTGKFSGSIPKCNPRPKNCRVVAPVYGGSNPLSGYVEAGKYISYFCKDGYKISGDDKQRCNGATGRFSGSLPRCIEIITCRIPMTRSPLVSSPSSGVLQVDESVSYFCDGDEYDLVGSNRATCLESGKLSASAPRCVLKTCTVSESEMPINGDVSPSVDSTVNVGESITYSCGDGFIRDGAELAVCKSNGDFTYPPPACIRVQCTVPRAPTNGQVMPDDVQKVNLNDYVSFKCDDDYKLIGSSSIQCVDNEVFDDSVPTCEEIPKKKCIRPKYDQRSGRLELNPDAYQYDHGTKLTVKCVQGLVNRKEYVYTYCNDGAWAPRLRPICQISYH